MKKILLVEDNKSIVQGLDFLLSQDYSLTIAMSKKQAEEKLKTKFDLIILDIMLGDGNGFDLARNIAKTPILFLTAKDDDDSIVNGLNLGEDYLIKPFRNQELLARIKKILARYTTDELICGDVTINLEKKQVSQNGENIAVTTQEFKVLQLLFTNKNQVVSREQILAAIWDINENFVNDNTLSVTIKRIRQKIGTNYIKTIKGFGYMVDENEI